MNVLTEGETGLKKKLLTGWKRYPVMFAGLFVGIKSGNMMNEGAVKKLVIVMLILSGGALVLNNL